MLSSPEHLWVTQVCCFLLTPADLRQPLCFHKSQSLASRLALQGGLWGPGTGWPSLKVAWLLGGTEGTLTLDAACGEREVVPPAASSLAQEASLGAVIEVPLAVTALAAEQDVQQKSSRHNSVEAPRPTFLPFSFPTLASPMPPSTPELASLGAHCTDL